MDQTLTPPSRPRRGVAAALVATTVAAVIGVAVLAAPPSAQASGLARFASCQELQAWGRTAMGDRYGPGTRFETVGASIAAEDRSAAGPTAAGAAPSTTAASATAAGAVADAAVGATNVVVDGVDEPDLVDHLDGDRVLIASVARLSIVDLAAGAVEASAPVPYDAQVTYDAERGIAWVVGQTDQGSVQVERFAVGDGALSSDGRWVTDGRLVAARRVGPTFHVVATTDFAVPAAGTEPGVPFAGGPVPCDQVLHPDGPSAPSATLIASLEADGPVAPVRSTEVVGSGQLVHVTEDAAYLATPQWDPTGEVTTGLHRFDLASLAHTGSGSVEGSLSDDFSISEHDGYLRVAVTHPGPIVGDPIPVDVDVAVGPTPDDVAVGPTPDDVATEPGSAGATEPNAEPQTTVAGEPAAPRTTVADEPGGVEPNVATEPGAEPQTTLATEPGVVEPSDPTVDPDTPVSSPPAPGAPVEPTVTLSPVPVEPVPVDPGAPAPEVEPLNEVVVLDTDGDLEVVGRTTRFGHAGETIHGVRFDGTVGYAVTFRRTDPFFVLDLADPTRPQVIGEVELPGFSAYLHPLPGGLVAGFGPDARGQAAVKLFDVADPTRPRLVDELVLGSDSPVVSDHHAFVDLGEGRFAVPVTDWTGGGAPCPPDARCAPPVPTDCGPAVDCLAPELAAATSQVVVVDTAGGSLREVERHDVRTGEPASRLIATSGGWAVLAGSAVVVLDAAGAPTTTIDLSA